jgi:hypothetical protein
MSQRERESESKNKSKSERERERKHKSGVIIFLNRPGQSEKSVNYTVLYRKEQYSMQLS